MATNDLTTLADVKSWLGRSDTNSDGLLAALIGRASRQILSYLQRPLILPHAVNELRDGTGGKMLQLKEWPIIAIASVSVDGVVIPQSLSPRQSGWTLSPWNGVP